MCRFPVYSPIETLAALITAKTDNPLDCAKARVGKGESQGVSRDVLKHVIYFGHPELLTRSELEGCHTYGTVALAQLASCIDPGCASFDPGFARFEQDALTIWSIWQGTHREFLRSDR